jgi:asparagine synthase (glutamine-hydrolysing)
MDEPFHSPNMHANFSVWQQMAKLGLRVSLNGSAGDELFAGYSNDFAIPYLKYLARERKVPQAIKELLVHSEWPAGLLLVRELKRALQRKSTPFDDRGVLRTSESRLDGPRKDLQGLLLDLMGNWRMNYWLRSGHQSCMGVPMEVRAPFQDVDLVDYVFRLPVTYLIRDGWHKWILRKAMAPLLPEQITWRKRKMGFPFPIRDWLAHSKNVFFGTTRGLDCPFLDADALRERYDALSQTNPNYLWRAMSVALWWKRCVLGEELR